MMNSSLGAPFALVRIFRISQTPSLVSRPKFAENYESQIKNPSVVDSTQSVESSAQKSVILSVAKNPNLKNSPSLADGARRWVKNPSLRDSAFAESWQSKQNNLHEVQTESRPIRGAKNRNQGRSSASADFLLESEKRGTPPKREKRQLLGTQFKHLGGAEAGGVALLRKKIGESKSEKIVGDSRIAKMDSSPMAQNDEFMDYHE